MQTLFRVTAYAALIAFAAEAAEAKTIEGRATKVRDGDTIVVSGIPVRLNGIDAPETSNRYGREARSFMARLVRGRTLTCELNGDRTYDRWVGVCFIKNDGEFVDIGAVLIANGFALDCARYSGGRYRAFEPAGARQRLRQANYC